MIKPRAGSSGASVDGPAADTPPENASTMETVASSASVAGLWSDNADAAFSDFEAVLFEELAR